jgi:hypothetical protein
MDKIHRWWQSAQAADHVCVLDVGSTDGTVEYLLSLGVEVHALQFGADAFACSVNTWRYDTFGKYALDLLPDDADLCVNLDTEDFLLPDWRDLIQAKWLAGTTKIMHTLVQIGNSDRWLPGPNTTCRIHARHGFKWQGRQHKVLISSGDQQVISMPELVMFTAQSYLHADVRHMVDLLKQDHQQYPACMQTLYQLAMHLAYISEIDTNLMVSDSETDAINHLRRFISISDRRQAFQRSMVYWQLSRLLMHDSVSNLLLSIAEYPLNRAPWLDLSEHYLVQCDWPSLYFASTQGLSITHRMVHAYDDPRAWGPRLETLRDIAESWLRDALRD